MAGLPIGVRFRPTKLELVEYFLRIKQNGQELPPWYPQIIDFDVYTDHPFNILASTKEKRGVNDVNEGYFFSRLNKLTPKGKRISRCIKGIGTWSEKAGINEVCNGNTVVGIDKYLKFKPEGKSNNNNNEKEDEWMMHEYYRLGNEDEKEDEMVVLCHITKKPNSTKDGDERCRQLKRGQTCAAIMPMDYEASSSKRGRIEYEQPSGFNNSGIINPNQDYVTQAVDEGYQVEYCCEPQGNINSVVVEASNEALTKEIQGMHDVDNADNQAYEDDGILQLAELGDHQVYDMEPLPEQPDHGLSLSNGAQEGYHIEDTNQFLQDAEQAYWLPTGDSLTAGYDSTNAFGRGFDELDQLDLSIFNDADVRWLLETPITA